MLSSVLQTHVHVFDNHIINHCFTNTVILFSLKANTHYNNVYVVNRSYVVHKKTNVIKMPARKRKRVYILYLDNGMMCQWKKCVFRYFECFAKVFALKYHYYSENKIRAHF